jgi:Domain of unknown function (DUF4145)
MAELTGNEGDALTVRGHCPACGPQRKADITGEHRHAYSIGLDDIRGSVIHRILKCRGCDGIYFQRIESNSEDYDHVQVGPDEWEVVYNENVQHWPRPSKRRRPDWFVNHLGSPLDSNLNSLLLEVYTALDNDLGVLAAIGIRTVFDRASELLDIDPSEGFAKKLTALENTGKIGRAEREILDVLTNAGNAAAHRGWRPEQDALQTMMDIIEAFIYRSFVLGQKTKSLQNKVPSKIPRK